MKFSKILLVVLALPILLIVATMLFVERVPPATIAVRQSMWGGTGVEDVDFGMGFHLGIVGIHKWHYLDRRTHFLTFASGTATSMGQLEPPLVIRTKDNNTATFDLSVTYRIKEGEGHLMVKEGLKDIYHERVFTTVESILREELAQLSSEQIYDPEERLQVARGAEPRLAAELKAFHVEPLDVLIRAVSFTPAYEEKLQEKQLTYQKRLLATAQERVERQRAITDTKEAEIEAAEKELRGDWDKKLEQLRATNEVAIAKIHAEARVYDRGTRARSDADYESMIAAGGLAVTKAEALRDELRNQALDTLGGRIYLAQQAAQNLNIEEVTLNTNDPSVPSILDIGELVKLLIGEEE